jgi:Na+/H+ antiporter NhaD/arsenite permease-like protein
MELRYSFSEFTAQLFEQKLSKIIFIFIFFNNLFILQVRLRKIQLQQKQRKLKANNNRKKLTHVLQEQVFFSLFFIIIC